MPANVQFRPALTARGLAVSIVFSSILAWGETASSLRPPLVGHDALQKRLSTKDGDQP